MRRPVPVIITVFATALAAAGPAAAQQGVTIDPSAPSSKEYEIPLEGARRDAAGGDRGSDAVQQGERSAPLFGQGVGSDDASEPPPAAAGGTPEATAGGTTGARASRRDARKLREAAEPDRRMPAVEGRAQEPLAVLRADAPTDGGFIDGATIAALAFAVLVLGGVLGSILRRRGT